MIFTNTWLILQKKIFPTPSSDVLFNLYRDVNPDCDRPDAAELRRNNLRTYMATYEKPPPVFMLAEAPGPWGHRFSGVPLVSEAQLEDPDFPLEGTRTSLADVPHSEYSAGIYWRVMGQHWPHFFTWNAVLYHPHYAGRPMSIRTPSVREVSASRCVLQTLLGELEPKCVVAVGRKAERALLDIGVEATYVRHPSQGGAKLFASGVSELFSQAIVS